MGFVIAFPDFRNKLKATIVNPGLIFKVGLSIAYRLKRKGFLC